ncbi:hypothetical protein KDW74_gp50 [Mycobacterium phage Antsirabe]|jgi:hypothetical protein|uniref:Uncharacterized protein n=1 Tax=Mycobacterium phage Antsirabe TaxID=2575610 RepID=A0A5J6TIW6_9CAUD|nr:hypothetical protein KDW74_gp50 [Mycobacterium phage Antsirabe]QFG10004.1 hypothetical protein PBI_ANTSIRABE_50 [Mycobacterium phage Antsirabe]
MAPAQGRENAAIFNPLVLALPNWHPNGPDGEIDGFAIPFVMPPPDDELAPNRHARIDVYPDDLGRWAAILSNVYMAGAEVRTADQARALAGAWIRAAEVLDNVAKRAAAGRRPDPDGVVDCEVVEDDDEPDHVVTTHDHSVGEPAGGCPACSAGSCTLHAGPS